VGLPGAPPMPPPARFGGREGPPGACTWTPPTPPFLSPWPPFPSSPSVSLSLTCTLPVQELEPPWPPPRATVPHPPASSTSREGPQRHPLPPRLKNRSPAPGVAAVLPDSSPENRGPCHQIRHRWPSSGQANLTGESPVSIRSGQTPPRASPLAASPAMADHRRCVGAGQAALYPRRSDQRGCPRGPRAPPVFLCG
jgi:hypothetical protein